MNKSVRLLLCFAILLLFASTSLAQKRRHRHVAPAAWGVPEVFSNLDLEVETGDVGGMEVILVPTYSGTWATVVTASGVAEDPVLVRVADDHYPNIEFTLPPSQPDEEADKFTGKITNAGLTLWLKGRRYGFLPRQNRRP